MIRVEGLRKRFGRKTVLEDVSVDIPAGGLWGLIGPGALVGFTALGAGLHWGAAIARL